ncbi:MAG: Gfo/Idh/MocA family protein [Phycisphaerales bacterium]
MTTPENDALRSGIDRRTFVQGAAVAAAAVPAVATLARGKSSAPNAGNDGLKVGLIGCGGRGTGAALQALRAQPGNVLHAMADVFPEKIEGSLSGLRGQLGEDGDQIDVPEERRFVGFDAYKKLLESGVDVVILTTPPGFRPAQLEAAVEAGKHVFTEKPMAVDAPGVRQCIAACEMAKAKQLCVVAGFCWRYGDGERAVFDQINAGGIGDIMAVHTTYHSGTLRKNPRQDHWSDTEWQLRNWQHFCWLGGDHIVEQACHSVDRLSWAFGDQTPVRCTALGGNAARRGLESGDSYDHFTVIYEYANGARGFHTCRQIDRTPSDNSDYIYGTQGTAEVNGWKPIHELRHHDGSLKWEYDGPRKDMYQNEHDHLFKCIREGTAHNDGSWMMQSTMMAIMGRMAAYTGQVLEWDDAMNSELKLGPDTLAWGPLPMPERSVPGRTKFV